MTKLFSPRDSMGRQMAPGFKIGDRVRTVGDVITGRVVGFVLNISWAIIYVTHSARWPGTGYAALVLRGLRDHEIQRELIGHVVAALVVVALIAFGVYLGAH